MADIVGEHLIYFVAMQRSDGKPPWISKSMASRMFFTYADAADLCHKLNIDATPDDTQVSTACAVFACETINTRLVTGEVE